MSVYPEFLEYIHEAEMYVPGHNYEEMYNIMVYNLTHNIISTNNFIYTYAFMNQLYDYLEELLLPDTEDEETNNLPINNINLINNVNTNTQNQNQNQNDHIFQQIFNYYNITPNQPLTNEYINNVNNMNNTNEFTYTNLVYYNNL